MLWIVCKDYYTKPNENYDFVDSFKIKQNYVDYILRMPFKKIVLQNIKFFISQFMRSTESWNITLKLQGVEGKSVVILAIEPFLVGTWKTNETL